MSGRILSIASISNLPTNLDNAYTSGASIGGVSMSNRRALGRATLKSSNNLKDCNVTGCGKNSPNNCKVSGCSGFCMNGVLQPPPGSVLPIYKK